MVDRAAAVAELSCTGPVADGADATSLVEFDDPANETTTGALTSFGAVGDEDASGKAVASGSFGSLAPATLPAAAAEGALGEAFAALVAFSAFTAAMRAESERPVGTATFFVGEGA